MQILRNNIVRITLLCASPFVIAAIAIFSLYHARPTNAANQQEQLERVALSPTGIIYVDKSATGSENGTDWANAYTNLQLALTNAVSGTEIWVASGVYTPGNTISQTFALTDGVAIYGGFFGTETSRLERDWETNVAVLSGDIDGDNITNQYGVITSTTYYTGFHSNSSHVVRGLGITRTAVLDGFVVTGGRAFDSEYCSGGGLYNENGSPTVRNVIFSANIACYGGGMENFSNSHPFVENVQFINNSASWGGGMRNVVDSNPILNNVYFEGNSSTCGGGMLNWANSHPKIYNTVFKNNHATNCGGGISLSDSSATVYNVVFTQNSSDSTGGGLDIGYNSDVHMLNSTFSGNSASNTGGAINLSNGSLTATNVIAWDNLAATFTDTITATISNNASTATLSYSILQNSEGSEGWQPAAGIDGGHNLDLNPLFLSATDLQLRADSPAINAGNTISYTSPITTDVAGNQRIFSSKIDIGAYEAQLYPLTINLIGNGTGKVDGTDIDCGSTCAKNIPAGQIITLTARAEDGSIFTGWAGVCGANISADCVLTLNEAKEVTATFDLKSYPLITIITGTGSGTITKSPDSLTYTHGTTVTLTATAESGSNFTGWRGECSGTSDCVIAIGSSKTITAVFDLDMIDIYLPIIRR